MKTILGVTRRAYFRLHQSLGLWLSALLVLSALTGSILVFRGYLKQPTPKVDPVENHLRLDALVAKAVAAGDGSPATDVGLPLSPKAPYVVYLDDDAETIVYLDGAGNIVDTRASAGGFTRLMFQLHTGEMLGTPGQVITVATGLGLCSLVVSGLAMLLSRRRK